MDKLYNNGLVIGRFDPIHLGHNKLIYESLKRCRRTLVLVGSAQESQTLRNPLDIQTRIDLIQKSLPDFSDDVLMIRGINDLKNELNNDFSWGEFVKSEVSRHLGNSLFADLIIYGNDPVKRTWFNPSDIPYTYELFVPRNELSATYVRGLMVINDKNTWEKMTSPLIHDMYDEVKEKILNVPIYQEIATRIASNPSIENFLTEYKKLEKDDYLRKIADLQSEQKNQ